MNNTEHEESVQKRAIALCQGQSPYSNILSVMDLVRQADALGFNVVLRRRTLSELQENAIIGSIGTNRE